MKHFRSRFRLLRFSSLRLGILLLGTTLSSVALQAKPGDTEQPRLAVVIVVDQLRGDYLERFAPFFGDDGFRRFLDHGTVFTNAHYRHALTATAPGHATLLTGVHANRHGIVANEWRDPELLRAHTSVSDPNSRLVGAVAAARGPGGVWAGLAGASPHRLLATTVGDQLKLRYGERSRVISMGHKDRSPIMMGGRLADAAYWLHEDGFVTSTFYRETLPPWVSEFNASKPVARFFGSTWDRLLEPALYETVQGRDEAAGEEAQDGLGTTFPRRLDGGQATIGPNYFEAFRLTPAADDVLGELAERALVAEKLGHHEGPDLLCIAFSTLDYVGHSYGPDSHEVMDIVVRLDRVLARLFAALDREVGAGKYVAVLSADHGVAPLPERVQEFERGVRAGRLDVQRMHVAIQDTFSAAFGPLPDDRAWAVRDGYGYRLQRATLQERQIDERAAAKVLKQALLASGEIAFAYTRDELIGGGVGPHAPHIEAWRLSYHAERSPDVVFTAHPYIVDRRPAGTSHGTPYDYDTHVPLAWYGAGVGKLRIPERVGTDSLAPTLSALLGVPTPPEAGAPRLF